MPVYYGGFILNATPSIYHVLTSSISLFRPYIRLDLRGTNLYPRNTCTFCANKISDLSDALRALYGLRRVHLPMVGFLSLASTIHLLNLPSETSVRHLRQALHDLRAMSTNHSFAGKCIDMIRSLAVKWQINLPDDVSSTLASRPSACNLGTSNSESYSNAIHRQIFQPATCLKSSQESHSIRPGDHDSHFVPPTPPFASYRPSSWSSSGYQIGPCPPVHQMSMSHESQ